MSEATLRENLDKMHRWTFGAEGEFGKGVARELVQQVSDALAERAASLPNRAVIMAAIRGARKWVPGQDVMRYDATDDEFADAVLAALSNSPEIPDSSPELAELFPGTLAALDHLSIRPEANRG